MSLMMSWDTVVIHYLSVESAEDFLTHALFIVMEQKFNRKEF